MEGAPPFESHRAGELDEAPSQIRNPKSQIGRGERVSPSPIGDFGFRIWMELRPISLGMRLSPS